MPHELEARRVPFAAPLGRQLRPTGSARGALLSALVHAAVIAALLWLGKEQFVDANRGPGFDLGRGGGGGGGGPRAVTVFTALAGARNAPPAVEPVAVPPVAPPAETPTTIPEPVATPAEQVAVAAAPAAAEGAGAGAGTGTGEGPGSGTGTGGGIGSGVGTGFGSDSGPGGGGGTVIPPQLRGILIPPPGRPRELSGKRIRVTFRINELGEVVEVVIEPQIQDRRYRNEFLQQMRRYVFTPAYTRVGRQPIASQVDIEVRL